MAFTLTAFSSADLYIPSTGSFTFTGSLTTALCSPTAILLNNGKVLILGGPTEELYDPSTGTFSVSGTPKVSRAQYTATLLPSGEVLVDGVGGPKLQHSHCLCRVVQPCDRNLHPDWEFAHDTLPTYGDVVEQWRNLDCGWRVEVHLSAQCSRLSPSAELYNPSTGNFTATEV